MSPQPSTNRPQSDCAPLLQDDMGPLYSQRALAIARPDTAGDWPELYVLAQALGCRIDVYGPPNDADWCARYALGDMDRRAPRWCMLRDAERWTPLVGRLADEAPLAYAHLQSLVVDIPDGPMALFAAVATLCLLTPQAPEHAGCTAQALRRLVAAAWAQQAALPYAQRDAALMQMLALSSAL